jgi:hypothetical protein
MIPSEHLELAICRFADALDKAQFRPASIGDILPNTSSTPYAVVADALHDLHARGFLEVRQWQNGGWLYYGSGDHAYFYRDFQVRLTFSGRKHFERLEADAAEESRVDRMPVARLLDAAAHQASLRELREAHSDLSKRPEPDLTGVVQHCMAALECTATLIAGMDGGTLGDVLKGRKLNLQSPLSEMLEKAWGFASDRGRHVKEGKPISYPDAELVLNLCDGMIVYLLRCFLNHAASETTKS